MTNLDKTDPSLPDFEPYGNGLERMKVPGGYIYTGVKGLVFVPTTAVNQETNLLAFRSKREADQVLNPMRNL